MSEIEILKDPYLVIPKHRTLSKIAYRPGMTVGEATFDVRKELQGLGFDDFAVTVNGYRSELSRVIKEGDFIAVSVKHGEPFSMIQALVWTALYNAGMYAAINAVSYVIAAAVVVGAGMMVSSIMAPSVPGGPSQGDNKPSYSWSGVRNETEPGNPVPVAYGRPYSAPQIIGSYRLVTDDLSMWQYLLLVASAGKTNNILTDQDVYIGDELLTAYTDYSFGATDGSTVITDATRTALAAFDKVHHDRVFDKRLQHNDLSNPSLASLLHFNSVDISQPIDDSSGRSAPNWTKYGAADLSATTPKFGAKCLALPASGDYIGTDDFEAMRFDVPGQFEFWFRLPDLSNRAFCSQTIHSASGWATAWSITTIGYRSTGHIYLQSLWSEGNSVATISHWDVWLDMPCSVTLSTDTWYYCRLQTYYASGAMHYQLLLSDGATLEVIGLTSTGSVPNPDLTADSSIFAYGDESPSQKAKYAQYWGMGYDYNPVTETLTQLYGCCDLDEIRVNRGLANASDDTAVPAEEFSAPVAAPDPFVIPTRSKCDTVRVIIEFSQGLFKSSSSGIGNMSVDFRLDYRASGSAGAWTTSTVTCSAARTGPSRFQFTLNFPSRDQYDVRIERVTYEDPNNDNNQRSLSYLTSVEEIINLALYYPGMQVIAIGVKASDSRSGQLGAIRVHHNRTQIDIPDWSGTGTQTVAADIPAYQLLDAFTNAHYGENESILNFPQASWEEWRDWTEGLVGGIRRAQSHIVFDEQENFADSAITHIEQVGRARIARYGPEWVPLIDKPKTPQYTFSSGNIIKKSFEWSSYEETEKTDAVEVCFWNSDKLGARDSRMAKASWFAALDRVPKIAQIEVRGIITAEQALREAQFRINKNQYLTRHGKHRSLIGGALIELGDVCHIIPPASKYVFGGRLIQNHNSDSNLYIDQYVTLESATYAGKLSAYLIDQNGKEHVFDITGPWGTATNVLELETDYSIRSTAYRWVATGTGTSEYRCELSDGGDPEIDEPDAVLIDGTVATRGTAGSLEVSQWDYAASGGINTIIVRLEDDTDPDTKAAGFVEIRRTYTGSRFDVYGLGRISEDKLLNQVVSKTINAKEKVVDLEWCQYDERIFYDSAYGGGSVPI